MKTFTLHNGNCLDIMKTMESNSVDSIVTDPPYGLSFMGKKWDYDVPSQEIWEEALRVLKPGGYLLAFAGTRTQHRMAVRIEDAGFEIRDMIAWVYGSGFPKSMDISKAIDKMAGAEREVIGEKKGQGNIPNDRGKWGLKSNVSVQITAPATDDAKQWEGWGTALKPALEPITVARKPLEEKTVAANVLKYGTGGINIDASRVKTSDNLNGGAYTENGTRSNLYSDERVGVAAGMFQAGKVTEKVYEQPVGRFPANFIHDGSEEVVSLFPHTKAGGSVSGKEQSKTGDENTNCYGEYDRVPWESYNDNGSAARFFYCAKTSKKDRNEGLDHLADKEWKNEGAAIPERGNRPFIPSKNNHPTVKPTDLMRYLVRMVTPKGGTVLDPFMGSGSTGKAAILENFKFVGIELGPEYMDIARARIEAADPSDYEDEQVVETTKETTNEVDNLFDF
jgi:DNA modification methylase